MQSIYAVVVTGAPGSGAVTEAVARDALAALGKIPADTRWLAPDDAWEAQFKASTSDGLATLRGTVAQAVSSAAVDVNIVPGEEAARRKRLLCADMESTIIQQELIDEIASLVGCHAEISAITAAAMRGELDFAESLKQRVALFKELDSDKLDAILDRVTLMPGAATLIATMYANGAKCALISGGFTIFAERIGARLGFDTVVANVLEIENGRLTGRVREPIVGPEGKADALRRLAAETGLDVSETLAVGDGANDVAMLVAAGLGVAFRAKPVLIAEACASANGAVITHGDLTALLHLQGVSRSSFAR